MGTAAVAYGAARSRIPRKPRPFTVVPKKEAKRLGRYKRGRYIHYRPENVWNRLPQIDVQERRARNAHRKPRTSPKVLKGAGTIMIVGGKALPTLAYGYVGYDIYRRRRAGQDVNINDEVSTLLTGQTHDERMQGYSDVASGLQASYHMVTPILRMAWRLA